MEDIRAYLLSVTAAAILCGIMNTLTGTKGTIAAVMKLLSGIVLSLAVLQPLGSLALEDLGDYLQGVNLDAADAVEAGTQQTNLALGARIKEQTEAYILDKAAELSLELTVEVQLDSGSLPKPVRVVLRGAASPHAKTTLQELIYQELGIPKEAQTWI